jgi:hypothetical protein
MRANREKSSIAVALQLEYRPFLHKAAMEN